jgi:hypothetical protein
MPNDENLKIITKLKKQYDGNNYYFTCKTCNVLQRKISKTEVIKKHCYEYGHFEGGKNQYHSLLSYFLDVFVIITIFFLSHMHTHGKIFDCLYL